MCSVCTRGERSCAPECADKLVKWGVVPCGTLTLSAVVFLPSHIVILLAFHFITFSSSHCSAQSFYLFTFLSSFVNDVMVSVGNLIFYPV